MIDLYYWTTPNGHKISIMLEEAKLFYSLIEDVNLQAGGEIDEQARNYLSGNR